MANLYASGSVIIDEDFAKFGSKSYAIDKINTVDVREHRSGQGGWIVCALISAICVLSLLGDGGTGAFILAAIFGFIAFALYRAAQIVTYRLFLVTSSSEAQAFETTNAEEISGLRAAIESAMVQQKRNKG